MNLQKKTRRRTRMRSDRVATIREKQLSMAATARVIWLCACVRYLPYSGVSTCAPVLIISFALKTYNLAQNKIVFFKDCNLGHNKWNSKPPTPPPPPPPPKSRMEPRKSQTAPFPILDVVGRRGGDKSPIHFV